MNKPKVYTDKLKARQYKLTDIMWRDQYGTVHEIASMSTKHLFFTVRMIWNHTAPPWLRIQPYKGYRFLPYYGKPYIKAMLSKMIPELLCRLDLDPYFMKCIDYMRQSMEEYDAEATYDNDVDYLDTTGQGEPRAIDEE
jgi:hypothetical protein